MLRSWCTHICHSCNHVYSVHRCHFSVFLQQCSCNHLISVNGYNINCSLLSILASKAPLEEREAGSYRGGGGSRRDSQKSFKPWIKRFEKCWGIFLVWHTPCNLLDPRASIHSWWKVPLLGYKIAWNQIQCSCMHSLFHAYTSRMHGLGHFN